MHESGSDDDGTNPTQVPDATSWWYGSTTRACPLEAAAAASGVALPPVTLPGAHAPAPVPHAPVPGLPVAVPAPVDASLPGLAETLRAANSQAAWAPAALAAAEAMPSALPLYRTLLAISRSSDLT